MIGNCRVQTPPNIRSTFEIFRIYPAIIKGITRNKTFFQINLVNHRSRHQIQTPSIGNFSLKRRVLQRRGDLLNRRCDMYGKKASELVKEFDSCESGQLVGFNNDLFAQVIEECNGHLHHLQSLLRRMQEEGADNQATKNADHFGALIHHLSLVRNKRCLMAYVYNRAELIRSLGWTVERVLPEEIEEKLSSSEKDYFKNHSATLQSYMSELDLDLAVDMIPPKDPYLKVRVLDEIGNVVLSDQSANLARHAILFLRRTDAEQYISQGLMEELTG